MIKKIIKRMTKWTYEQISFIDASVNSSRVKMMSYKDALEILNGVSPDVGSSCWIPDRTIRGGV